MNRRELLKTSALGLATLSGALITSCSKKEGSEADATATTAPEASSDVTYVSESDTVAQSLGYKEDANSVDAAVRADKGDTKGADQFCTNCRFYTATEGTDSGKCTLFPGKSVKGPAWCKSWSLKQA